MIITIDEHIRIELIEEKHAEAIFQMVDGNRDHLRPWLPFVDRMQTIDFARNFVQGTMQRNREGMEYACVVFHDDVMVGRIGVYKIDGQNKTGEIGYWIAESAQGKGIIARSCLALTDFCFGELQLNRIEIRCGTENYRSKMIPQRLNFTHEGILRQAEWLYDRYIDLDLY